MRKTAVPPTVDAAYAGRVRPPSSRLRSVTRPVMGVALGAVSWPVDLIAASGGMLRRPHLLKMISRWQQLRVRRWIGSHRTRSEVPTPPRRAIGYLLLRVPIGILSAVVLGLLLYGCWSTLAVLGSWLFGARLPWADIVDTEPITTPTVLALLPVGLVLLFLNLTGIAGVASLERVAADYWLHPSPTEQLQRRVDELTVSRSDLVRALDAERSRIERDLHDGVQQRVVALGLLVGRARRQLEPQHPGQPLLEQAHQEASGLLDDLRDVAWRINPATLESEGLLAALTRLADRADPPTTVRWDQPTRLPPAVESCIFHLVAEALTNVARHARATQAVVIIDCAAESRPEQRIRVRIVDDGVGGAVPRPGHGLAGLTGRAEAAGGSLAISSPPSGPTELEAVLPCA